MQHNWVVPAAVLTRLRGQYSSVTVWAPIINYLAYPIEQGTVLGLILMRTLILFEGMTRHSNKKLAGPLIVCFMM